MSPPSLIDRNLGELYAVYFGNASIKGLHNCGVYEIANSAEEYQWGYDTQYDTCDDQSK